MAKSAQGARKDKSGWSVPDKLQAASIAATLVVSLLSLAFSSKTRGAVAEVKEGRVEIDTLPSNSDAGDPKNPWVVWEEPVTPTTLYIGIKRRIQFKKPFDTIPRVSTGFGVINLYPIADRLRQLGFTPTGEAQESGPNALSYDAQKAPVGSRLLDFHLVSFAAEPDNNVFTLETVIGLPTVAGQFLASVLQRREPSDDIVSGMRRYGQLPRDTTSLTPDERWLTNFYTLVGSLNLTWTAQQ